MGGLSAGKAVALQLKSPCEVSGPASCPSTPIPYASSVRGSQYPRLPSVSRGEIPLHGPGQWNSGRDSRIPGAYPIRAGITEPTSFSTIKATRNSLVSPYQAMTSALAPMSGGRRTDPIVGQDSPGLGRRAKGPSACRGSSHPSGSRFGWLEPDPRHSAAAPSGVSFCAPSIAAAAHGVAQLVEFCLRASDGLVGRDDSL